MFPKGTMPAICDIVFQVAFPSKFNKYHLLKELSRDALQFDTTVSSETIICLLCYKFMHK